MNALEKAIKQLERKYKGRIERAKVVYDAIENKESITEEKANDMIRVQYDELKTWTVDQLIREFCDPEDLLYREALKHL